ncbi:hypothetical protein HOY80DRAFT_1050791 [Tuber brumale]|nr:hypothetical protein HOY80DRAFT_1050791 [Tuber brumale]
MSGSLTIKHSPKYEDFLFDGTVTLYVGQHGERMEIHKKLLASISPELDKHVNNDMKEGIEGIIRLPDEDSGVLTLFAEWAYTGDYGCEDTTPSLGPPFRRWVPIFRHLRLYIFSDKFNVSTLKQLAERKFHTKINSAMPTDERDAIALDQVIHCAHDNLPSSDPIVKFLARYASWRFKLLRTTD